jgi:hypothetical protein
MASVARFHPELARIVVVADGEPGRDYQLDGCRVILPPELIPDPEELRRRAFIYDVIEFCCCLKPRAIQAALREYEHVVYLDSDTLLLGPLPDCVLDPEAAVSLTPHRLRPAPLDGKQPDEAFLKTYGVFNLGFAAVSRAGDDLLAWWDERLGRLGSSELSATLFTDQRWLDLAPAYFDVTTVRHAGMNVAKWNVDERPLRPGPGQSGLRAGEDELVMVHFSGMPPSRGTSQLPLYLQRSRARARNDRQTLEILADLGTQYRQLLAQYRNVQCEPYGWGYFPNGQPIPRATRRRYRQALIAAELANRPQPEIPTRALPGGHLLDPLEELRSLEAMRTGWRVDRERVSGRLSRRGLRRTP